jgi:hypothetical protein
MLCRSSFGTNAIRSVVRSQGVFKVATKDGTTYPFSGRTFRLIVSRPKVGVSSTSTAIDCYRIHKDATGITAHSPKTVFFWGKS